MAARSGRDLLLKKNGTAIAGLRNVSIAFTADGADITDKMDGSARTMGDWANLVSFEISADGVAKDTTLRDIFKARAGFLLTDMTIEWDDGEEWACNLFLSAYDENGPHDAEVDFSATLMSSGAWSEVT